MILKNTYLSFLLVLVLGIFQVKNQPAYGETASANVAQISGTFIQYQSWMLQLDSSKWLAEMEAIQASGIDTLVIQWLKSDQTRFYPIQALENDPTEIILKYADQKHLKVFLGLQFEKSWWTNWDDEDFLSQIAKKNISFGKKVLERYGKHQSLAGWYIPYEMSDSDYDEEEVRNLQAFLKKVSSGLKALSPKKYPVSLSTFFQGKIPAAAVQKNYTEILKGSGIDIIMVQDGVGVHNWTGEMQEKVLPYFAAFRAAAAKNKVRVWSVVENFTASKDAAGNNTVRAPTDIVRLKEQLQLQSSGPTEKVLTFDFFHYMSPHRGPAQKQLYDSYLLQIKK